MYCPDTLKRINTKEVKKAVKSKKKPTCDFCDKKSKHTIPVYNPADSVRNVEGAYGIYHICDTCYENDVHMEENFHCSGCGELFITHHSWDTLVVTINGEQYCHKCALEAVESYTIKDVINSLKKANISQFVRLNIPNDATEIWTGEFSSYSDFPGHTSLSDVITDIERKCEDDNISLDTEVIPAITHTYQFSVALGLFTI